MNGPLPAILRPIAPLAEAVYRAAIQRRNAKFDARQGVIELDRPVLSVGNLSVGGTGKTPFVLLLLRLLRERGCWPCVAMRGYAQRNGLSDEAEEYRAAFPDLPLVVHPNRTDGLLALFATPTGERVDCVVLDDGFQHRQIARTLDIVLIDATRDPFADRLLPRGWLREPVESLHRADAVVLTHAEAVDQRTLDSLRSRVAHQLRPNAPILASSHVWASLTVSPSHSSPSHPPSSRPLSWLSPRRSLVCCAIGNPGAFVAQARTHTKVVGELVLRDHDPFTPATVHRLHALIASSGADTLLVTRKDWSKLSRVQFSVPVAVPDLTLQVDPAPLNALLDTWKPLTR